MPAETRAAGVASILPNADVLYNSATVPHDTRWELPLPSFKRHAGLPRRAVLRTRAEQWRGSLFRRPGDKT